MTYDGCMELFRQPPENPAVLAILAGSFNPPTRAHLALAEAGLTEAPEVLFVLPRLLPHKTFEGVGFAGRLQMLEAATTAQPRYSIAVSERGLFLDIARECREVFGSTVAVKFLCGRDAAERAVHWNYGRPGAFLEMLGEFELLVASRGGAFQPPAEMRQRIHALVLPPGYDEVSATEVRERIARSEPWEHLVPEAIVPLVRKLYRVG